MKSERPADKNTKILSGITSPTPSIDLLQRRFGKSPTPRMLTPYEIDLMRKAAKEIVAVTREILRRNESSPDA